MTFDHIGIVVHTIAQGRTLLAQTLGIAAWTAEFRDDGIGVFVQFGRDASGTCYELVAPITGSSPVSRVLAEQVNIINHVAYRVENLDAAWKHLKQQDFTRIGVPAHAVAFGGARVQFFVSEARMMIELIEAPDHVHEYLPPEDLSDCHK